MARFFEIVWSANRLSSIYEIDFYEISIELKIHEFASQNPLEFRQRVTCTFWTARCIFFFSLIPLKSPVSYSRQGIAHSTTHYTLYNRVIFANTRTPTVGRDRRGDRGAARTFWGASRYPRSGAVFYPHRRRVRRHFRVQFTCIYTGCGSEIRRFKRRKKMFY